MYVDRSSRIPPGIDGHKPCSASRVGPLEASKKFLTERIEARIVNIRIRASRVALPQIDESTRDRLAAAAVDAVHRHRKGQPYAGLRRAVRRIGANVGPIQLFVDEV